MRIHFFILSGLLAIFLPSNSRADHNNLGLYSTNAFPLGGNSPEKQNIQHLQGKYEGYRLEYDYLWGESQGILLGGALAKDQNELIDYGHNSQKFQYSMSYPALVVGYWAEPFPVPVRIWGFGSFGYGIFRFKDPANTVTYEDKTSVVDIGLRAAYVVETSTVNIPLIFGLGMLNELQHKFNYNGKDYGPEYFNRTIYTMIGIGADF